MGDYSTLDSGGTTGSEYPMRVYLYYNYQQSEEDAIDDEYSDVINNACGQLIQNGAIGRYIIKKYEQGPCVAGSDKAELKDNFHDYLEQNGLTDYSGAHILVTDDASSGVADAGNSTYWNAFGNWRAAIVPLDTSDYGCNVCLQETLHPFLNSDLSEVEAMLDDNNDEHELGTDYSDGSRSSLATSYDNADKNGDCANGNWHYGSYSPDLTNCTKDGVEYSRNDVMENK